MDNTFKIRIASINDLPRLVEILNQAIDRGNANAHTEPFSVETRKAWFENHDPGTYPIYVCENSIGQVIGYLAIGPYRNRPALARTGEISYYVDYNWHGRGVGSALMTHAIHDCFRIHKQVLLAVVLEWNLPSIRLLEKFGFKKWGFLPEVAEIQGKVTGHLYYGRSV
jgi:L-amino acid N-acyltransferase YncA